MSKKKKKKTSSTTTMTRTYTSTTITKPAIRTSDIDTFIGRTTTKDEIRDVEEFFYYSRFEPFVLRKLHDEVSKNDIVRTWNLITRNPIGLSNTKRLPFSRLNLVKDYIELEHSYNKVGKKIDTPGFIPIFCDNKKIQNSVDAIEKILLLFLRPWHFKVTRYLTGIALWINPKVDAIIKKKTNPGNIVTYYQKGQTLSGGRSVYSTRYSHSTSTYFDGENDYFDSLQKSKTSSKNEDNDKKEPEKSQIPIVYPERKTEPSPTAYSSRGFFHDSFRSSLDAVRDMANDRLAKALHSLD